MDALYKDLKRSHLDTYMSEIRLLLEEVKHAIKKVRKWSKPFRIKSLLITKPSKCFIYPEPYGLVLFISPWNYPFYLVKRRSGY